MPRPLDLIIIGAGPYGLSLCAHALKAGLRTAVVGRPMDSWKRHMPAGMYLETEGFASNLADPDGKLTLAAFCATLGTSGGYRDFGWPVPLDTFLAYGEWFRDRLGIDVEERLVVDVRPSESSRTWVVTLDNGASLETATVAVAMGLSGFPYIPPELAKLPSTLLSHASSVSRPSAFAGRRVAIVGAGQSSLELSALIAEAGGQVTLVARRPALRWSNQGTEHRSRLSRLRAPRSPLGDGWPGIVVSRGSGALRRLPVAWRSSVSRSLFPPTGAWWLRPRVEEVVSVRTSTAVRGAEAAGTGVCLELARVGGETEALEVDHVVAATGYRPSLSTVGYLAGDRAMLVESGTESPVLSAGFEASQSGICFTGALAAASFGPSQLFLPGISIACRGVIRTSLVRRLRGSPSATMVSPGGHHMRE